MDNKIAIRKARKTGYGDGLTVCHPEICLRRHLAYSPQERVQDSESGVSVVERSHNRVSGADDDQMRNGIGIAEMMIIELSAHVHERVPAYLIQFSGQNAQVLMIGGISRATTVPLTLARHSMAQGNPAATVQGLLLVKNLFLVRLTPVEWLPQGERRRSANGGRRRPRGMQGGRSSQDLKLTLTPRHRQRLPFLLAMAMTTYQKDMEMRIKSSATSVTGDGGTE